MKIQKDNTAPVGFDVVERWVERIVVLTAVGDLDMLTAPVLTDAIQAAMRTGPSALIVDLSTLDFLASAGMSVLITAQRTTLLPSRFGVVADGPATRRPLELVGIDSIVSLYRTLDDALEDLQPTHGLSETRTTAESVADTESDGDQE